MRRLLFRPQVHLQSSLFFLAVSVQIGQAQSPSPLGPFEDHLDIGTVLHAGTASFDVTGAQYTITASGDNMWATADAFHFVWKNFSGDVSITADIAFPTKTGNPHKKAVLMIRQSLDADSSYVDAALHLAGLTSLQSRAEGGGTTHEIGIDGEAATRLRLVKRGSTFFMYVARAGEKLHLAGGSVQLAMKEPFYIGLGVCAHDKDATETAVFSNVNIEAPAKGKLNLYSTLETISVSSTDRRVVAVFDTKVQVPRWTPDGTALIFQQGKRLKQIPAAGGEIADAPTGQSAGDGTGDKTSPDGQRSAALSYSGKKPMDAELSMKTLSDGKIKLLAKLLGGQGTLSQAPWSPDGKRLVFVSYQMVPQQ